MLRCSLRYATAFKGLPFSAHYRSSCNLTWSRLRSGAVPCEAGKDLLQRLIAKSPFEVYLSSYLLFWIWLESSLPETPAGVCEKETTTAAGRGGRGINRESLEDGWCSVFIIIQVHHVTCTLGLLPHVAPCIKAEDGLNLMNYWSSCYYMYSQLCMMMKLLSRVFVRKRSSAWTACRVIYWLDQSCLFPCPFVLGCRGRYLSLGR